MTQAPRFATGGATGSAGQSGSAPIATEFVSGGATGAPPSITEADGINGIYGQAPDYSYFASGIPVGVMASFTANAEGTGVHIVTATWTGGTTYSSYISDTATTNAPQTMKISANVNNSNSTYAFIVDSQVRTYNLSVTVTYGDANGELLPGTFTSNVTFTSYSPTASITTLSQGTPKFYPTAVDQGISVVMVQYDNKPNAPPTDYGMRLQTTVTTQQFGGAFMFLQIITPQRTLSTVGGSIKNANNGIACLDAPQQIYAYPRDTSTLPNGPFYYEWTLGQNVTDTPKSMGDTPSVTADFNAAPLSIQVGGAGVPESFRTFVMYMPNTPGAVWVAIAESDWSWSKGASRPDAVTNWTETAGSSPAPTAVAPPPIGPEWSAIFDAKAYIPA